MPNTLVQFVAGASFYASAFRSLRAGDANMDVLVMTGSSVAYLSSLGVTLGLVPGSGVYFETGAAIITLVRLGRFLEARAKGRTSAAIEALMGLQPRTATVVRDGVEVTVAVEQVEVGDTIVLRPGESVPVDGIITAGRSARPDMTIASKPANLSSAPKEPPRLP